MAASGLDSLAVILLLTADTDRTAAFYRDVLGVQLWAEEHDGKHQHYAAKLGSVYFTIQCLADFSDKEPDFPNQLGSADSIQLCFQVENMDDFLKRLQSMNVKPLHKPLPFEHTVFTTLRDPDGRAVRIMTPWKK